MKTAIEHYEAALKEAFPKGATGDVFHHWNEARKAVEQPAQQQEPVATVTSESGNPNVSMSWWHEPALPVGTPLYTRPQAREPVIDKSAAIRIATALGWEPKREPLTNEQIESLWDHRMYVHCSGMTALRAITRAIEDAHGITGVKK